MDINEIIENFSLLEEWDDKYEYLISLGKRMPEMPIELKCDANRISGCISNVWIVLEKRDGKIHMQADSDAQIVKGLLAVLVAAAEDSNENGIKETFIKLGLTENLTPNRRNGLNSAIEHVDHFIKANI